MLNSAIIGAIFGWILGTRAHKYSGAIGWGLLYGFAWWILGGLILMPLLLGMSAFAPLQMEMMRPVAMGSLIGHLIYGFILGGGFAMLSHGNTQANAPRVSLPRCASRILPILSYRL